jgi:nucleoside-diphosphate-sugar epimerase
MMTDGHRDGCSSGRDGRRANGAPVLILGCGYTGRRAARLLLQEGRAVTATTRLPEKLGGLAEQGVCVVRLDCVEADAEARLRRIAPQGCLVLYSVPSLEGNRDARVLGALEGLAARVVYLSTTSVYGAQRVVDATTKPAPASERERARMVTEEAVLGGPWSSLVLRPAAIYGPGRGVHVSMARGEFRLEEGAPTPISRIHVDDLARLAVSALGASVGGAYPVADAHPCPSLELAQFCAGLMGLPMPEAAPASEIPQTRRRGRRVDGSAILELLGVRLQYPTYREGIRAALAARADGRSDDD